jgi:hypothetical protein
MLFTFVLWASARKFESILEKYQPQLKESPSIAQEEETILYALSDLARQVDKSVTAEEVKSEINSKITEILENVENADFMLRQDFQAVRVEFNATRTAVGELVLSAHKQISDDIQQFRHNLIESLHILARDSSEAHTRWFLDSSGRFDELFEVLGNWDMLRAGFFFVSFQILLAIAIKFRKKIDAGVRKTFKTGQAPEAEQI